MPKPSKSLIITMAIVIVCFACGIAAAIVIPNNHTNYAGHLHYFVKNTPSGKVPCISNEDMSYISCKWSK